MFKSYPEIHQLQSAGEKSLLTSDITLFSVQHCVNFSSKLKATNVSAKHILKSNTLDKIIQAIISPAPTPHPTF